MRHWQYQPSGVVPALGEAEADQQKLVWFSTLPSRRGGDETFFLPHSCVGDASN